MSEKHESEQARTRAKVTEATLYSDGDREVRARLYHESGVLRLVERNGPHIDDVNVDAEALRACLAGRSADSDAAVSGRRYPIQGGLTISWAAAEEAYRGYSRLYGDSQSLARIAERGGFGLCEFVCLVYAGRAPNIGLARDIVRGRPSDAHYVEVLAAADVRASDAQAHHEPLRQPAEVTAERDALCLAVPDWHTLNRLAVALQAERDALETERDALQTSLAERRRQVDIFAEELRKWQTGEYLDSRLQDELDALKRRVDELDAEVRSLRTYDQFSDL